MNMKNNHIKILNNITNVLSFDELEIYIASELNIILNHIDMIIKASNVFISKPNVYKYNDTGRKPIKNENMNIKLFPNSFPVKISNSVIL